MKIKTDHCFMRGQTKDDCFKLMGYLEWFDKPRVKNKEGKSNNIAKKGNGSKQVMNVNKQAQERYMETPLDKKFEQGESSNKLDLNTLSTVIQ